MRPRDSAALVLCVVALASSAACRDAAPDDRVNEIRGETMGTTYSVKTVRADAAPPHAGLKAEIERILDEIDRQMSSWNPSSEISRFNALRSTEWQDVSGDTQAVVAAALEISRLTEGAFDVTAAPLIAAWGFGAAPSRLTRPSASDLRRVAMQVGYGRLEHRADPPGLRKARPDLEIDVSAIAKGFAVDRIAEHLDAVGAESYLVEIGGELRTRGRRGRDTPWTVAIERPVDRGRTAQLVVRLENRSMATSGDYRNWFAADGVRYSHVLDPRTGEPIAHGLASVTVIAASATDADALATALLVLGPRDGPRLAKAQDAAALFITRVGGELEELRTDAFRRYVEN